MYSLKELVGITGGVIGITTERKPSAHALESLTFIHNLKFVCGNRGQNSIDDGDLLINSYENKCIPRISNSIIETIL